MNNNIWRTFHKHTSISDYYLDYDPSANFEKEIQENYYNAKEILYLNQEINNAEDDLKDILIKRKSIRDFNNNPVYLKELLDLLIWSYGTFGYNASLNNTVPSAGARYPIEIHIINNTIKELEKGVYHYNRKKKYLEYTNDIDMPIDDIVSYCLNQPFIHNTAAIICLCADFDRTISKYGDRGYRYVFLDAGHIGQNLYLMSTKNKIGIVGIGGFKDEKLKSVLRLPINEYPIYLFAIGK